MLPIKELLVPSAFPAFFFLMAILSCDRSSKKYQNRWLVLTSIAVPLCFLFWFLVESTPLPSQRHGPSNPGGHSAGFIAMGIVYLVGIGVAIPSFPALVILGILTPKSFSRKKRLRIGFITIAYVAVLASLVIAKDRAYAKDFSEFRNRSSSASIDRFKNRREQYERIKLEKSGEE